MPYKFNDGRRHKLLKAKCRVADSTDDDAALVPRGLIAGAYRRCLENKIVGASRERAEAT